MPTKVGRKEKKHMYILFPKSILIYLKNINKNKDYINNIIFFRFLSDIYEILMRLINILILFKFLELV